MTMTLIGIIIALLTITTTLLTTTTTTTTSTTTASSSISSSMPDLRTTQVVIIGAGAAGLQASRLLREASISVILLEARDRIGGRIHTSVHNNVSHDEGAAWVHGIGYAWPNTTNNGTTNTGNNGTTTNPSVSSIPRVNPMLNLLQESAGSRDALWEKELKPIFPTGNPWMRPKSCLLDDGQLAIYLSGQLLNGADDDGNNGDNNKLLKQSLHRHWQIMDEVDDIGQNLLKSGRRNVLLNQSLQETIDRVLKKKDMQRHTKLYKQYSKMEQLRQFYVHLIELWYAGAATSLQLNEFVDKNIEQHCCDDGDTNGNAAAAAPLGRGDISYTPEGDFFGPHCTVASGMSSLLKPLMGHGEEILTGQEVISIQENNKGEDGGAGAGVLVETRTGLVIQADACIVTIPLACLKVNSDSLFQPKLSAEKNEAFSILRVGGYKKVFLTFDRIFWSAEPAFVGFLLPDSKSPLGKHLLADNLWARDGIPCLEVILTAKAVVWANGKSTELICDTVLEYLTEAVAMEDFRCIDYKVTRWEEDPFSMGAYSTFGIGCEERHATALRAPEWNGKLVFAGEHTVSEFEGSVHAALFSGYNSAKSVSDYLETCLK